MSIVSPCCRLSRGNPRCSLFSPGSKLPVLVDAPPRVLSAFLSFRPCAMGDEVHQPTSPSANDHRHGSLPVARALPRLALSQRAFKASGLTTFRARRRHWDSQNPAELDFAQPASVPGRPPAVDVGSSGVSVGMPGEIIVPEEQPVSPAQRAARMLERHSSSASMSPNARSDRLSAGIGCENESSCSSRRSMEAALEIRAAAGGGPYQPAASGPSTSCDSSPLLLNPIAASSAATPPSPRGPRGTSGRTAGGL